MNDHVNRDPCIHFPVAGGALAMLILLTGHNHLTEIPTDPQMWTAYDDE